MTLTEWLAARERLWSIPGEQANMEATDDACEHWLRALSMLRVAVEALENLRLNGTWQPAGCAMLDVPMAADAALRRLSELAAESERGA